MTFDRIKGYIPGLDWQSLKESRLHSETRLAVFDKIKVTFRDETRWEMEIF